MGEEIAETFRFCEIEWSTAWVALKQFKNLFASGPERVELLNENGQQFFFYVNRYFLEGILTSICRLTDPPNSVGKPNLSLQRLKDLIGDETQIAIEKEVDAAVRTAKFARNWRNQRIAHNSLDLNFGTENLLPSRLMQSRKL